MQNKRIFIVDDEDSQRMILRHILTKYGNFDVVGEAGDGIEAIEKLKSIDAEIIIMDICMPKMGGVEATKRLLIKNPDQKIIFYSGTEMNDEIMEIIGYGAKGFIKKNPRKEVLLKAIETVLNGDNYIDGTIMKQKEVAL